MHAHDLAREAEAHPGAVFFGCEEGDEYFFLNVRWHTGAVVRDLKDGAAPPVDVRAQPDARVGLFFYRLNRIQDQVDKHLLNERWISGSLQFLRRDANAHDWQRPFWSYHTYLLLAPGAAPDRFDEALTAIRAEHFPDAAEGGDTRYTFRL